MNWLHNGQPIGAQGSNTTEDGAYYLNGAATDAQLMAVTRKDGAKYWIPTENEWYKAAYYDPNKPGGPGYWDYPTGSDNTPSNQLTSPDPGNNANFNDNGYTIGSPYYRTPVGAFTNSESPYGTFDQGGNVHEWNETVIKSIWWSDPVRGIRGGCWYSDSDNLLASVRSSYYPTAEGFSFGFRVASVPEPGSLTLMLCGALAGVFWWWRRGRSA